MSVSRSARALAVGTFLLIGTPGLASAQTCGNGPGGFFGWLAGFRKDAAAAGISQDTLINAFADVRYDGGVIRLDRSQSPFKVEFDEFVEARVTRARISKGRRLMAEHADLLAAIYKRFAVPGHVLMAIWGLETDFGAVIGDKPVFQSIATLAYDCRRAERFRGELMSALRVVERGDLRADEMRGAWAGELGQTQFLASSYERFAIDFDNDGRADLLRSSADVLGSTANYLYQHFWQPDGDIGPGTANFEVLGTWNKSSMYQRTIAILALEIADQKGRKKFKPAPRPPKE